VQISREQVIEFERKAVRALREIHEQKETLQTQVTDGFTQFQEQLNTAVNDIRTQTKDYTTAATSVAATVALDYSHFINMRWYQRWLWLLTGKVSVRQRGQQS